MFLIQQVTSDAKQRRTLILPDGTSMTMTMFFIQMQQCWVITEMIYGTFVLNGLRITVSPNMLRQFKNQIPFGLACYANQPREPSLLQDFSSNSFQLYILDAAEVKSYEEILSGNLNG